MTPFDNNHKSQCCQHLGESELQILEIGKVGIGHKWSPAGIMFAVYQNFLLPSAWKLARPMDTTCPAGRPFLSFQ
jgi:hypothetical protein